MSDAAHPACVLETRKTAPGLRLVDKWAVQIAFHSSSNFNVTVQPFFLFLRFCFIFLKVLIGGGENHRMGLFDMVMIKDNHISIAGGIANALKSVDLYLEKNNLQMGVEVAN